VTGPFFCIIRHRGNETGLIEHAGAKLPGEKADLAIDDLSKLGKSLDPFCDVRSFIAESRNTCDLQAKGGERLAKLVVKVAGDSPAFIFLDRKEPPQEIEPLLFDPGTLLHLLYEDGIRFRKRLSTACNAGFEIGARLVQVRLVLRS